MTDLWHTIQLPLPMLRTDIDFKRDYIDLWNFDQRPYHTMVFALQELVQQEFIEWFYIQGLPLMPYQMMFATAAGAEGYLHKDTHPMTEWNGKYCRATLNYHMTEHTGSLVWYDCPEAGEDWTTEAGTPAERYSRQNRKELARWSDSRPALCRVDQAHAADNAQSQGPRVVISLRFIPNPDWQHVVTKLQPWLAT